jgi:hypothetical protein
MIRTILRTVVTAEPTARLDRSREVLLVWTLSPETRGEVLSGAAPGTADSGGAAVSEALARGTWMVVASLTLAAAPHHPADAGRGEDLRPQWVAMTLIFWALALPDRVGVFWAFGSGLVLDVATGTLLGHHALGLSVVVYAGGGAAPQRIRIFPLWQQAVRLGPAAGRAAARPLGPGRHRPADAHPPVLGPTFVGAAPVALAPCGAARPAPGAPGRPEPVHARLQPRGSAAGVTWPGSRRRGGGSGAAGPVAGGGATGAAAGGEPRALLHPVPGQPGQGPARSADPRG